MTGQTATRLMALGAIDVFWDDDHPARLGGMDGSTFFGAGSVPLVEIFTASDQRARTSQAYIGSAVGSRLRVVDVEEEQLRGVRRMTIVQRDAVTGLVARSTLLRPDRTRTLQLQNRLENSSSEPVVLTALPAGVGFALADTLEGDVVFARAESEWLAENRWSEVELRSALPTLDLSLHGQDARGRLAVTSHGAWSSGEHLPAGILSSSSTGESIAWQIETSGAWHWELSQRRDGGVLTLSGPTDVEHQFAHELAPGEVFDAVPVALAVSDAGRDGVIAELTAYRRWLRSTNAPSAEPALAVVYNDFMNTLMGQPTTEALTPLIDSAADAGAEVFCIDAGWFADPAIGDWWSTVGQWREAPSRFTGGLGAVIDHIHARGMRSGLWLEPEVVGVDSPAASFLPDEAFFTRFGRRVREHDRFHLDFRHPAVRAHLHDTVDHLVSEYGISYLKLDYNINPGAGTDWVSTTSGDGLLAHTRAFRSWLVELRDRHPSLSIENCSSGAMRADYSLLAVTELQSTSDQQDFRLYPPIAASAPATIAPEQCANWAYPHADMTDEETAFTLVTGLAGRLYLSGFLHTLRPTQTGLVQAAVERYRRLRSDLSHAVPFWPLGLPGWDDDTVCLGLRGVESTHLLVWDRTAEAASIDIPGVQGQVVEVFPAALDDWAVDSGERGLRLITVAGHTARLITLTTPDSSRL